MKVSCDVIKDLIPLYAEGMLSDDTIQLVESHLEDCEECRHMLNELKQPYQAPLDTNAMPLLKVKAALRKKKLVTIILTFVFALLFFTIFFAFVTEPKYIPYSQDIIQVDEQSDGSVVVEFSGKVSDYQLDRYSVEGESNMSYRLTTWTNSLDEFFQSNEVDSILLNTEDEIVSSVYYDQNDGSEYQLIYGIDENPNGGTVTLPRLNLSYYLGAVIIFSGLCLVVVLLFRQHKQIVELSFKAFLLPVAYVIAHLIIMGMSSASYHSTRDLLAIILITMPLYALMLLGLSLYSISRERNRIEKIK
ncbi:zf-HC2 domain-containing protein [Marinilactibacillus sp. Marseille-P9653]|uniref:zf-HC2 domain-containing protein n=1 Tax=Marinilactibacillus sp. Marseille-P9653 TaxID=2866583 RepID=UPI001CE3C04D|nr:zf-HC2 domain-containing protein [Marinilactibacillus sp. Marseille-P9653]